MAGDLKLDIKVVGATAIANKYRAAASRHPSLIDKPVHDWCNKMARVLAKTPYPPPPAGSTYTRTYTLPTGWATERVRDSVYAVINTVDYSHWVVSQKLQAWMHKGRWWTAEEILKKNRKELNKNVLKAVKDAIK